VDAGAGGGVVSVPLWVGVVAIGGCGSLLRFLIDGAVAARSGRAFPLGTLVVNVSGALALGFAAGLALGHDGALLAGTAAAGSYTTFSTWMLETQRLGEEGDVTNLWSNVVVSVAAGLAAAELGRLIGGAL
jgi:CrcB protein